MTSSYSRSTCAAATHSGRSCARAEAGEVLGVEAALDGPHQQVAQLAAEAAGRQRRGARDSGHGGAGDSPGRVPGEQLAAG